MIGTQVVGNWRVPVKMFKMFEKMHREKERM